MTHTIGVIGGDGIGPEVTAEALKVLRTVSDATFEQTSYDLGAERYLATGEVLPDRVEKVSSVAWAADDTLFYVTEDSAKRPHRLWRHTVGADAKDDALIYEEKDERFNLYSYRTLSREYLMFTSDSATTSETRAP